MTQSKIQVLSPSYEFNDSGFMNKTESKEMRLSLASWNTHRLLNERLEVEFRVLKVLVESALSHRFFYMTC